MKTEVPYPFLGVPLPPSKQTVARNPPPCLSAARQVAHFLCIVGFGIVFRRLFQPPLAVSDHGKTSKPKSTPSFINLGLALMKTNPSALKNARKATIGARSLSLPPLVDYFFGQCALPSAQLPGPTTVTLAVFYISESNTLTVSWSRANFMTHVLRLFTKSELGQVMNYQSI